MIDLDIARCSQTMVEMRDGVRLNTFVFVPRDSRDRHPVIVHRTPYGITTPEGKDITDPSKGWVPNPEDPLRGAIMRGWREIVRHGYAVVYQDTRGRYGSEGEDRVYYDDATDGYDTLEWIADQPWSNQRVGLSGSSACATTALAAASQQHPSVQAFYAQVGGASIYNDVVYEGHSIELERLWLWVGFNTRGLSAAHRSTVAERFGLTPSEVDEHIQGAWQRFRALSKAADSDFNSNLGSDHDAATVPFLTSSADWMHLPLTGYPDFSVVQPFLDEILTHPTTDDFRQGHDFVPTIEVPGFHATSWYDVFMPSVLRAYQELQARVGNQKLWIGPNAHYFIYDRRFWLDRVPYFEWFGHWLKDEPTELIEEAPVYFCTRSWVDDPDTLTPTDWAHTTEWPPPGVETRRLYLTGDGALTAGGPGGPSRSFDYDPHHPVPTIGGRNMSIEGGSLDQRPAQALPHYGLTYTGDPLDHDVTIAGRAVVAAHVGSDCPDTDFVAKLIEVHPDGRAMLLMDGVVRAMYRNHTGEPEHLEPGEVYAIAIELGDIHHTLRAGSRIQVDITSSNFPRRIRNTNSGHPIVAADSDTDIRVAHNVVHHSPDHPTFLEFQALMEPDA